MTGSYDLLATATAEEVRVSVRACLEKGITMVAPPVDIYPPGKIENIR